MDLLLKFDTGQAIGFDGEGGVGAVDFFEKVCRDNGASRNPVLVLNWLSGFTFAFVYVTFNICYVNRITHDLPGQLAEKNLTFSQNPISPEQQGQILDLILEKRITRRDLFVFLFFEILSANE